MKKNIKRVSTLLFFFTLFSSTFVGPKPILPEPNKPTATGGSFSWQNKNNYILTEKQASKKMSKEIKKKFGKIYSFISLLWPFNCKKEKVKIELKNKELREIKNISQKEMESTNNYKKIICRELFTRYVTKIIKKQVPVTDFRDVERKKYNEEKLKHNTYGKIIQLVRKKSYNYTLKKTKSSTTADIVKTKIANELIHKIKTQKPSLREFIGKNREKKIDTIINKLKGTKCAKCSKTCKHAQRVFLHPCGHTICKQCLAKNNRKCPICGAIIEKAF